MIEFISFGTQEQWVKYLLPIGIGWLIISLGMILCLNLCVSKLIKKPIHVRWHYLFYYTCNKLREIESFFEKLIMCLMSLLTILCLGVLLCILFGAVDKVSAIRFLEVPLSLIGFGAYLIVMYIFSDMMILSFIRKWKITDVSSEQKMLIVNSVYLAEGVFRFIKKSKLEAPKFNDLMFWEIIEDYSKSNNYVLNELFSLESEVWKDWEERNKKKLKSCKNSMQN